MTGTHLAALLAASACAVGPPNPARRIGQHRIRAAHPAAVAVAFGVVVVAALSLDRAGVVLAGAIAGATAVQVVVQRRHARAEAGRAASAAAFIGHLAESVGAGAGLGEAAVRAAEHLPASTPRALRRDISQFTAAAQRGATLANAESPELKHVATLWALSAERGVPVADLLAAARDDIDHAMRHRAATEAALTGPKTTAAVLALLPVAGIAMGSAMGANPVGFLVGPGLGGVLLVTGTALVCAGVLVSGEIIRRAAA